MAELLRVRNLRKTYNRFVALNGVDMTLPGGRLTSIIGPNGAGKTTLINVITGYVLADRGEVFLDGQNITRLPVHERVRRGISRSFQITSIFSQLTVLHNVLLPVLARQGRAGRALVRLEEEVAALAEAEHLLEAVGLLSERDQPAGALSYGNQRLLEIAMALAPRPRLCFLDEPCAGMNPVERQQILDLIQRLAREESTTFVVVEHDMDVVFSISEWIVVMNRGEILTEGTPEMIRNHEAVREIYLGEEVLP